MKTDIYETITEGIIDVIETGCEKFEMPWNTAAAFPTNARTQRAYRGMNILVLWAQAMKHGYAAQLWATYQQWHELGAQVRKGEKSTAVVFWRFYGENEEAEDDSQTMDETAKKRCFARAYHVFNAAQVDGFELPSLPVLSETERIGRAEAFFANCVFRSK